MTSASHIATAVRLAGSQQKLAEAIGTSQQTISNLVTGRVRISAEQALAIHNFTRGAVSKHEMRPDLWEDA